MPNKSTFVTIVIPTFKDWDRLQLCLKGLGNQLYPQDLFEVIVVNNDPKDDFNDRFEVRNNVQILNEAKPGSYASRNKALRIAKGEIIGFTDSDCIPDADWIENAVHIFENNPNVDRIGGKMRMFYPKENVTLADLYDETFAFPQQYYATIGFAVTGNLYVRKKLFETVGLFDENLMSGGDAKWGKSANEKGFSIIYSDKVVVNHPTRSTMEELIKKKKRVGSGLRANNKKLNIFKIIYITLQTDYKNISSKIKTKNPKLNVYNRLRVSLLHLYLSVVKNKETYQK